MKKIYIAPACVVVELGMKSNAMLSASAVGGQNLISDGGEGDGGDAAVKESGGNIWDIEW